MFCKDFYPNSFTENLWVHGFTFSGYCVILIYTIYILLRSHGRDGRFAAGQSRFMNKDKRQAALWRFATKQDLLLGIIFAFLAILLPAIAMVILAKCKVMEQNVWFPLLTGSVFYGLFLLIWWFVHRRRNRAVLDYTLTKLLSSTVGKIMNAMVVPVIACDDKGVLFWHNDAVTALIHEQEGKADVVKQGDKIPFREGKDYLELAGHIFKCQAIPASSEDKNYTFYVLQDYTELLKLEKEYHDERAAVAYIVIDSVDELMQYVNDRFRDAIGEVDDKIKRWVSSMNGIIKSYDNDKYIVVFDTARLDDCIKNRFAILDKIRTTRVGDGISITVSMGVSNLPGTLAERERSAQSALDLALQRGGDQVVLKREDGIEFFGGKTKAVYKRSNVKARVVSSQLVSLISRAGSVLIMGHKNADFDSFASCVGMARLAFVNGVTFHIICDKNDKNLAPCFEMASRIPHLKDAFISAKEGLEKLKNNTLLIITDVNNFDFVEAPEVAQKAKCIAVIDHHIKKEELPETVKITYIEPTASSASELVSELLEYGINMLQMTPEEAELLLSGILLDTKQFSRNTGTRTFAVAQYLRGQGASTVASSDMFRMDIDDITKESRMLSSVEIFDDNIAIAACDTDTDAGFRVVAAKVADKMLSIKNVEATFALVLIRNTVYISGRSNGNINVQLILEDFHGGGHYDIAGAQVEGETVEAVKERLKQSILEYKKKNNK